MIPESDVDYVDDLGSTRFDFCAVHPLVFAILPEPSVVFSNVERVPTLRVNVQAPGRGPPIPPEHSVWFLQVPNLLIPIAPLSR